MKHSIFNVPKRAEKQLQRFLGFAVMLMSSPLFAQATEALVEKKPGNESVLGLLMKGGPVMVPLAICSIAAFTLGLERFFSMARERVAPRGFIDGLTKAMKDETEKENGMAYCDKQGGPAAMMIKSGIAKVGVERRRNEIEKKLSDVASREISRMKRSIGGLKIIAGITP